MAEKRGSFSSKLSGSGIYLIHGFNAHTKIGGRTLDQWGM